MEYPFRWYCFVLDKVSEFFIFSFIIILWLKSIVIFSKVNENDVNIILFYFPYLWLWRTGLEYIRLGYRLVKPRKKVTTIEKSQNTKQLIYWFETFNWIIGNTNSVYFIAVSCWWSCFSYWGRSRNWSSNSLPTWQIESYCNLRRYKWRK